MRLASDDRVARVTVEGDKELWRRSLDGDGEAFGSLFDKYRERVFRHAWRLVQTRHDAEDVVASAFLELWRRRADVRLVDGSVLPWLLVTTTNMGRNATRATRRYRQLLERLPRALDQPDAAETAFSIHSIGIDPRLRAGLHALKKIDAQLVALVALEGYPVGDAAELLELSLPAARARLHRARSSLREQLGDQLLKEDPEDHGGTR
jgi:RNA polymerase sigma factor (sigma-70 family)